MAANQRKIAYILSAIIALVALVASAGGVFITDLYRDNALVTEAMFGNDLVTLVVALPLLVMAMIWARRGSPRALLIWMGLLGYMLYNYVFYLYGVAFNQFFLLYVALFTLSIYALIFGLSSLDVRSIHQSFEDGTPVKWVGGWMLFFALLLGGLWIGKSLSFVVTGQVPEDVTKFDHPTAMVYATDLSLLVPALLASAIWLWRGRPWGYVLSVIVLVKASTYALVLIVMSIFQIVSGPGWEPYMLLWLFLGAGCLLALVFLLKNLGSRACRKHG